MANHGRRQQAIHEQTIEYEYVIEQSKELTIEKTRCKEVREPNAIHEATVIANYGTNP
jgi:hypothetical protein